MYKKDEAIPIAVNRTESNFDKAADEAYSMLVYKLGITESGHIGNVEEANRSECRITLEFLNYIRTASMAGGRHIYTFMGKVSDV